MLTNTIIARTVTNTHIQGNLLHGEVKKMKMGKDIICPNFHLAAVGSGDKVYRSRCCGAVVEMNYVKAKACFSPAMFLMKS